MTWRRTMGPSIGPSIGLGASGPKELETNH